MKGHGTCEKASHGMGCSSKVCRFRLLFGFTLAAVLRTGDLQDLGGGSDQRSTQQPAAAFQNRAGSWNTSLKVLEDEVQRSAALGHSTSEVLKAGERAHPSRCVSQCILCIGLCGAETAQGGNSTAVVADRWW